MKSSLLITLLIVMSILVLIATAGCAGIDSGRTVVPSDLRVSDNLTLPFKADKCLFDQKTTTYYISEQNRSNIYLYRNQVLINTLGGFGSEKVNFQKLSDIALDPDGNLLALDEFARQIRKYSPDGKWIADIDILGFNQPSSFCSTPDGEIIMYDSAVKELK